MATSALSPGRRRVTQLIKTPAALRTKVTQPESIHQAREHERYAGRYREAGLCEPCSYRVAYGHQLGFSIIDPPCGLCRSVVEGLPLAKANGWRVLQIRTGVWSQPEKPEYASA